MRLNRHKLVAAAAVPLLLLVGACGSANASNPAAQALDSVTVSGSSASPTVTLKSKPVSVKQTVTKVVTPGTGAAVTKSDAVIANYVLVNGKDGKQLDTSYGKTPAKMDLASGRLLNGLVKGLTGQKVGSRVLVAIPPADSFDGKGNAQIGVAPTDTLVFLLDITKAYQPLTQATGTPVAPKTGLPTVKMGKDNHTPAEISVPKTSPPTKTILQPLVQGNGDVIKAGQILRFSYTGVVWRNGKMFDTSATTKEGYIEFPIGKGQLIPGWDKNLVGQRVGSRVLMVITPADGYGAAGRPTAGIKGTDTLVFVVDLLDAS